MPCPSHATPAFVGCLKTGPPPQSRGTSKGWATAVAAPFSPNPLLCCPRGAVAIQKRLASFWPNGRVAVQSVHMNARNPQPLELNTSHKYGDFPPHPWWRFGIQITELQFLHLSFLRSSLGRIEMRAGSHPLGLQPLIAHCSSLCSSGR